MTNIAKLPSTETTVGYVAGEIRAYAARKGLSGRQLAFQLGKSQPWMSRRLTGEVPFDVEELDAVAALLGVAPRDLFPGQDSSPSPAPQGISLSEDEQRFVLALRASNPRNLVPKVGGSNPSGGTIVQFPLRQTPGVERELLAPVTSITGACVA